MSKRSAGATISTDRTANEHELPAAKKPTESSREQDQGGAEGGVILSPEDEAALEQVITETDEAERARVA